MVGVIANLAVYFAVHTLFEREPDADGRPAARGAPGSTVQLDPVAVLVAVVAAVLLFRLRWGVLRTLGVCALLGLVLDLSRSERMVGTAGTGASLSG